MKAIVCEMCSSHDLVKQDGVYVCQSCGTKYSVEEARKMMVEVDGTVDVSGSTVKVDNSDSTEKILQLARRAKEENNAENAAKYYEMVAINRADDWEASFYSVYFQSASCKIGEISSAANRVSNNIPNSLRLMKAALPEEERKSACKELIAMLTSLATTMIAGANKHMRDCWQAEPYSDSSYRNAVIAANNKLKQETNNRATAAMNMMECLSKSIWNTFSDAELAKAAADAFKLLGRSYSDSNTDAYTEKHYATLQALFDPQGAAKSKQEYEKNVAAKRSAAAQAFKKQGIKFLIISACFWVLALFVGLPADMYNIGKMIALVVGLICGIGFLGVSISAFKKSANMRD